MEKTLKTSLRSRLLFSTYCSVPWLLLSRSSPSPLHQNSRSIETLAYEEIRVSEGPSNSTAFVLHGLLGSGRNWRTFSRDLASELHKRSSVDDLRNHGKSVGIKELDPPHDMVNAARDLANLVKTREGAWPEVIIGHSMGGKVALEFAASCARGDYGESAVLPKQLWVLDSVPGEVNSDGSDGEVEKVLHTLNSLPASVPSRRVPVDRHSMHLYFEKVKDHQHLSRPYCPTSIILTPCDGLITWSWRIASLDIDLNFRWVVDHMLSLGFSKSLSEWIGSNLKKEGEHLTWTFSLQAAIDMFNSYRERSYWSLLEHPPKGLEIAIVQAENSDRWQRDVLQKLEGLCRKEETPKQGKISLHVLPNSGHWVHVDNPKGLLEIMAPNFVSRA